MKNKGTALVLKIFGIFYFIANSVVFGAVAILIFGAGHKASADPGYFLLVFPGLGILAGYWMWKGRFNRWRNSVIVLSLSAACLVAFCMIYIFPQVEKIKAAHETRAQEPCGSDADVSAFFQAVYDQDPERVRQALDDGVCVDARDHIRQTALHATQNEDVLRLLIARGADVNAVDEFGMTPMFNKDVRLLKILIEAGADIRARSHKGNTLLMWYSYSGYGEGVEYLISQGADIHAVNADGQTAYDIAQTFGYFELLEYFITVPIVAPVISSPLVGED